MRYRQGVLTVVLLGTALLMASVTGVACDRSVRSSVDVSSVSGHGSVLCPHLCSAMTQCPFVKQIELNDASKARMASDVSGKGQCVAENVCSVRDEHKYAVCELSVFEVTDQTPCLQVQNVRFLLDDPRFWCTCQSEPTALTAELDREAVGLATMDVNLMGGENSQKRTGRPVTGIAFLVTADSPDMAMDSEKYNFCDTVNLASIGTAIHK